MTPQERVEQAADIAASYREAIVSRLGGEDGAHRGAGEGQDRRGGRRGGGQLPAAPAAGRGGSEGGSPRGRARAISYCTDNAAMIGAAALAGLALEYPDYMEMDASASLPLGAGSALDRSLGPRLCAEPS